MDPYATACSCECHGSKRPCSIEGGCGHLHAGCGVCEAPTGDDGRLCRTHTDGLSSDLATVPDLATELEVTRTRQNRTAAAKHGGRSSTRPLPWNEHAAQKATELRATLNAWALEASKLWEDERDPLADVHHSDTPGLAGWLTRNLSTLRQHPEAGQAFHDITSAVLAGRRAIDKPAEEVTYGPCLADLGGGEECRSYLYGTPGRASVTCRGCQAVHDTEARKVWMRGEIQDLVGTATEAAGYLRLAGVDVSASTVRNLASRKRFLPVEGSDPKRPTYHLADVLTAVTERYKRRPAVAAAS